MKRLKVGELIKNLQQLIKNNEITDDSNIVIEGCDCNGYAEQIKYSDSKKDALQISEYDEDGNYIKGFGCEVPYVVITRK